MLKTTRRHFLAASAVLPGSVSAAIGPTRPEDRVAADLQAYIGFGHKQAGGAGDMQCGAWLGSELEKLGFRVERQSFSAPFFEPSQCTLSCGDARASLWPQPIVVQTGPSGVTGPLVRIDRFGQADASLAGAIALLDLPHGRWSSATAKPIREPIAAAFKAGARGVVVITNGPTGKIIALNADGRKPMFDGPVAVLAPDEARPFLAAALRHDPATFVLQGAGGRRPAYNLVGRIDRGKPRWLVVSTPRSGWYGCAGERGPGVAIWLWLARWASAAVPDHNLAFVCNSGHEYEYLGAAEALKEIAPKPADTHFWLHLGAGIAARDWHELPGNWNPLPSVDPQRFLSLSRPLLPLARRVFAGHPGYEAPYASDALAAGELVEIIAAGYQNVAGVFGSHRYHHVIDDDERCVSADSVITTAVAFQRFVEQIL